MSENEFSDWLSCLDAAEDWLREAFELMDGIEGYSTEGEAAHASALSAIRTVRTAELAARAT